jgi:hypothetical protein
MNSERFDGLARAFSHARSRRQALRGLVGIAAAGALALGGRAASADACKGNGKACKKNSQCCSNTCVGTSGRGNTGTCAAPAVCGTFGPGPICGSSLCGCPTSVPCGPIESCTCRAAHCVAAGETCESNFDCCDGTCVCVDDQCTCDCIAPDECASGQCGCSTDACTCRSKQCEAAGGTCKDDSDCCGGPCVCTGDGCACACVAIGGACLSDGACCSETCYLGTCAPKGCLPEPGPCQIDADCCSANCLDGICVRLPCGCGGRCRG